MTYILTRLPSGIFLVKACQLSLHHFMGEHLMQQVSCSVVPGWPSQHISISGVSPWFQDDLPNTFAWVVSICGDRMTCPKHLHEWCLSVVPGWPAQHIWMSGVYLWWQDDLPNTFAWVVSYLWCQDDLPNTFAWVVSICGARMTYLTHLNEWCLSVVTGWPAQHICMSSVYSPIYSFSKWQWESSSTCVSAHSQVNQYSSWSIFNRHDSFKLVSINVLWLCVFQFNTLLCFVQSESKSMFASVPLLNSFNTFFMVFIFSVFLLCSFWSNICLVTFASSCWFVLSPSLPTC